MSMEENGRNDEDGRLSLGGASVSNAALALGSLCFDEWARAEQSACALAQTGSFPDEWSLLCKTAHSWMKESSPEMEKMFRDAIKSKKKQNCFGAASIIATDNLADQLELPSGNSSLCSKSSKAILNYAESFLLEIEPEDASRCGAVDSQLAWIECAGSGLCLSAPVELKGGLQQAAGLLNSKTYPFSPFNLKDSGSMCVFFFAPEAVQVAIASSRMISSEWLADWIKSGAPSLGQWSASIGAGRAQALARLWMDASGAIASKAASPIVEASRWRLAHDPSKPLGLEAWKSWVSPVQNHWTNSMAANCAFRLLMSEKESLRTLGVETLLDLAKSNLFATICKNLEGLSSQISHDDSRAKFLAVALSRIQEASFKEFASTKDGVSHGKAKTL